MRKMLRKLLENEGYEVEDLLPQSVGELQECMFALAPDLVISDYQMPILNGLTVARMIKQVSPTTPVIILTAVRDPELEASLEQLYVQAVLHKPIDGPTLATAIRAALSS
jgi:CheY-like chemotaxis protein